MARPSDSFADHRRLMTRRAVLGARSRLSHTLSHELEGRDRNLVAADHWIRVYREVMARRFEVLLPGEHGRHVPAARGALDTAAHLEGLMTAGSPTSELARLNRFAHEAPVVTDVVLFSLLSLAREIGRDTEGAFDITATPLSRCWGSLRRQGRLPAVREVEAARASVGMDAVVLDPSDRTVLFRRRGVELNLGSIGTGFALDRMAAQLRRAGVGDVLLSAGQDTVLAVGGQRLPWLVALWSAVNGERLAHLHLQNGALGTCGAGDQVVEVDGVRYGQVIDPRTGWPASGTLSASVITSRAAVADALSTAFLIGGADLARRYCETHQDVLAIITPDRNDERPLLFGSYAGVRVEHA